MAKKIDPRVLVGDCLVELKKLDDESIDSIVTDPPYELGFMGKQWDASGIAYNVTLWEECLRVLKPGGHLLAFGGTRTYHRMAVAIEDAGFEIRDSIHWLYGSGFPKSLDVSKAIDKAVGAERKVVGTKKTNVGIQGGNFSAGSKTAEVPVTAAATDAAKKWSGFGTALKPAHEPIVVARKPLAGTVAANVLKHGTGALNVDGCRIPYASLDDLALTQAKNPGKDTTVTSGVYGANRPQQSVNADGRWPANIVIDDTVADENPEWSNFFYCAKPSKKERDAGLDALDEKQFVQWQTGNGASGKPSSMSEGRDTRRRNTHPTVKPVELMRWLVRLVTPPGGIVLDPFLGSGTTAVAATLEGFDWRGCEMTAEYLPIIDGRVKWAAAEKSKAKAKPKNKPAKTPAAGQQELPLE